MNIAEHIAYLIGDSKRVVIPIYPNTSPPPPPIPDDNTNNGNGNGNVPPPQPDPGAGDFFEGNIYSDIPKTDPVLDNSMEDTTGDTGIIIDDPMLPDPNIGLDPMPAMQQNTFEDSAIVNYIKKVVLEKWLKDTIQKTSKLLPADLKLHLTKSRSFTAGQWDNDAQPGIGYDLNLLDSSEILAVSRFDGEFAYDCRQIPSHLRSKARFGSGFLEECSETDPIYYVNDMRIFVEPNPEDTHLDSLDGFCTIDYICYPDVDANSDTMFGVPFDMQQLILIGTAVRCKKFQMDSLETPTTPILNPNFKVPKLDNEDINDAIDVARNLLDNYNGNSFKDFLETEDIDMATTALNGSAKALDLAATKLTEQDKVSQIYLSEYSQNISKFAQDISKYKQVYSKFQVDYNALQSEYEELIYSFRGELPNKKQLGASERKLENIKQVVNR